MRRIFPARSSKKQTHVPVRASQKNLNEKRIDRYLSIEKDTLNFMKPFTLAMLTLNSSVLAILYNHEPKHNHLISIFAFGILISSVSTFLSMGYFRRSLGFIDDINKFIKMRKSAYIFLQISVIINILTFEIGVMAYCELFIF